MPNTLSKYAVWMSVFAKVMVEFPVRVYMNMYMYFLYGFRW